MRISPQGYWSNSDTVLAVVKLVPVGVVSYGYRAMEV
jgi:hypothetical protein